MYTNKQEISPFKTCYSFSEDFNLFYHNIEKWSLLSLSLDRHEHKEKISKPDLQSSLLEI